MTHDYEAIARQTAFRDRQATIAHLHATLPDLWQTDYLAMKGATQNLLTITFGDENLEEHFCRYMFDHATSTAPPRQASSTHNAGGGDDRVVAVWGTSRQEAARNRDKARMKGFLKGAWSSVHPGYDRGHFFAHTMGGGLDINLFPQARKLNRGGLWRKMENYCVRNPGTFCFIRPIYTDATWRPAQLEYGIFNIANEQPVTYWGHIFEN